MKQQELAYRDSRDYSPIDVIKGVDLTTGKIVMADDKAPAGAEIMPKCKHCKNYKPSDKEGLGSCGEMFFAYGDMVAVTCDKFKQSAK